MESKWENIWKKRKGDATTVQILDDENKVLYLKELSGWDSVKDKRGLSFGAFFTQYQKTKARLAFTADQSAARELKSVYEVGCGCGANLYLFEQDGIKTGGVDYSENLIEVAGSVLSSNDLLCDEAIHIPAAPIYDSILSNSVFSYFSDLNYAESVLEKMLEKCTYSIGILDIHDENKKSEFLQYRRSLTENYDEKYNGLDKLFYPKSFFISFAEKHGLDIMFSLSDLESYWNNEFIFNCFLYKN